MDHVSNYMIYTETYDNNNSQHQDKYYAAQQNLFCSLRHYQLSII